MGQARNSKIVLWKHRSKHFKMKDLKIIAMENFNRQLFNRQLREVTKNKMMFLNDHVL